jgi:hypothetical protein
MLLYDAAQHPCLLSVTTFSLFESSISERSWSEGATCKQLCLFQ